MYKNVVKGNRLLKSIRLHEIAELDDEQLIVVNRIKINSMLNSIALSEIEVSEEQLKILEKASNKIKIQEKQRKCGIRGVEIKVSDVLKLFKDNDNIPLSTFAIIK